MNHPSGAEQPATRRGFLRASLATAAALTWEPHLSVLAQPNRESVAEGSGGLIELSEHLLVYSGAINAGVVRDGDRALLIDCGGDAMRAALQDCGITRIAQIIFTHHHRDQACGIEQLADSDTRITVPAGEDSLFRDTREFWKDNRNIWRVYRDFRQQRLMLIDPIRIDQTLADGDSFTFGAAKIRVLATPGHTDGSVSYLVEVDGQRVVFCGDCIYDRGQLWDVYSLQKGFQRGSRQIGGYHGFMGARWDLADSLQKIKQLQADVLIPSHGIRMDNPAKAIDGLTERLDVCYENYVATSALRHYFPELFTDYEGRPGQMPIRAGFEPPECLRHYSTSWILVSKSGAAFVMDVGSTGVVQHIKKLLDDGEIRSVDGLWVTHYHFDHTDGIPKFQQEFDCPCYADRHLAAVLTNPTAWHLPCLAPDPIQVHHCTEDGLSWQWQEFKLTAFNYPGQTLYHDALLVEVDDLKMLFVGDSHTMGGNDDYCAHNRNFLGRGVGFQYCLSLIERLQPTHIFNCHVNDAFTFTPEEICFMRENLDQRERLFGELVPWDHANYGTDASWVRCWPYSQSADAGISLELSVVVTNHSTSPVKAACRPVLPTGWSAPTEKWVASDIPAKSEHELKFTLHVPASAAGRYVIPIDVQYGSRKLPQFTEAIVDVSG